ncbi:MAG: hypothetical protein P9E24_07770 [Candidatus Competibacter sp.]|nr:hypothetical protein [Candidatus Competibacter sp.]MDG4585197.1 hypothetical protein [Candidatus Competibacter sp.]
MEHNRQRRRNPVAAAPILRKGGAHLKSKTAERAKIRSQLKRDASEWRQWSD